MIFSPGIHRNFIRTNLSHSVRIRLGLCSLLATSSLCINMEVCASTDQSTQLYIYMRYVLLIFTFYFTAGTWFRVGDNITLSGTTSETFKFADFAGNKRERDKLEHHAG